MEIKHSINIILRHELRYDTRGNQKLNRQHLQTKNELIFSHRNLRTFIVVCKHM